MRYHYTSGVSKNKKGRKWLFFIPALGVLVGIYVLINTFSPGIPLLDSKSPKATAEKLVSTPPGLEGNRLYVPQINVDVAVSEGGDQSALEKGAWHRNPDNGNPERGGNFVLSAHRFQLGYTPMETRAKSPFYNLDKLKVGDELFVDWNGKRYAYEVNRRYQVDRRAVEIEAATDESKLTLYSCDLRGEKAGREVVEAKPIGVVAWGDNNPHIEMTN